MQIKILPGWEGGITIGQRKACVFVATIVAAAYNSTTGDPLPAGLPFPYEDFVSCPGLTVGGNYNVVFKPSVAGPRATWAAFYIVPATGLPLANGVTLIADTFTGIAAGGDF